MNKTNNSLAVTDYLLAKKIARIWGEKCNFNKRLVECTAARNLSAMQNCILFHLASTCFPAMLMRKMPLKDQQRNMSLYQRIRFGRKVTKFRSHSPVHRAVLINSDRGGNQLG